MQESPFNAHAAMRGLHAGSRRNIIPGLSRLADAGDRHRSSQVWRDLPARCADYAAGDVYYALAVMKAA